MLVLGKVCYLGGGLQNKIEDLTAYLYKILGVRVSVKSWKGHDKLPFFLNDLYDFYEISLLEHSCLLLVAKESSKETPATIRKHKEQVQKIWKGPCIYVQETIAHYNRKRLIEERIPFIIPGNQLYLPEIGIYLSEYYRKQHENVKKKISPSTQMVVIYMLFQKTPEKITPSDLAKKLGYTLMTMTRAFDELKVTGICEIQKKGRELCLLFKENKCELWEQAKPWMSTPVKSCVWIEQKNKEMVLSGLSALSCFTALNADLLPIYAMSAKRWKELGIQGLPSSEKASFELEIWHYDPSLFAQKNIVNPFSLYLSLQEKADERIEFALEEMMRNIKW